MVLDPSQGAIVVSYGVSQLDRITGELAIVAERGPQPFVAVVDLFHSHLFTRSTCLIMSVQTHSMSR